MTFNRIKPSLVSPRNEIKGVHNIFDLKTIFDPDNTVVPTCPGSKRHPGSSDGSKLVSIRFD
jgi:hypothetical protein